jgi:hypothetical protein
MVACHSTLWAGRIDVGMECEGRRDDGLAGLALSRKEQEHDAVIVHWSVPQG